jgi:hypothetical protein
MSSLDFASFIYYKSVMKVMNSKITIGLALFCISGIFLALSVLYVFSASSAYFDILLPNDVYPGCSNCSPETDLILYEATVFAVIGGIIGSFGTYFVIVGYREMKLTAKQPM